MPEVQRLIAFGNLTTLGILVLVDLHSLITGAMGILGWSLFSADLILSMVFIFFLSTFTGQHK